MTAEIALLNKLAVTLAADSAVTIGSGDSTKVYNSADKIFEGTNHDPIGIMVYNSPELNGIPVEAIVKMYRDIVCQQHFATVFEFADAFLKHIEEMDVPDITRNATINSLTIPRMLDLRARYTQFTEEYFNSIGSDVSQEKTLEEALSDLEANHVANLDLEIASLQESPMPAWAAGLTEDTVIAAHSEALTGVIEYSFLDVAITENVRQRVLRIAALSLLKEYQRSQLTGLVFAGFGRDEIFPSLISFEIYGQIAGKLKVIQVKKFDVDRRLDPVAAVIPFAQQEMVDRFMYGLDAEFLDLTGTFFSGSMEALKQKLADLLVDADPVMRESIAPAVDTILREFNEQIVPNHLSQLQSQLSDMVRSMPKQELAALSESLVHITSLKRKFSAGAESVGGPIDVAMITRAEGFVWVKRKHYFDAHLNPRYFSRRYGHGNGNNGLLSQGGNGAA